MRIGFLTSSVGHVLLLASGFLSMSSASRLDIPPIDALAVDLVPISETTHLNEGNKNAPRSETPSEAKIEPPQPRPDSARVGAAAEDQKAPVTEKATETAAVPDHKPPPPAPAPQEAPVIPQEKVEKTEAPKAPEASKPAAVAPETPAQEVAEAAPIPASVKPRTKPKLPKPVTVASMTPERPPVETREKTEEKAFDPNEMAALLNKIDPSGGGGRASEHEASLGVSAPTAPAIAMSQSELDALRAAIESCWEVPVGGENAESMVVPIRIEFNIDGSLASDPRAKETPPGPVGQVIAEAALRAVRRCAPYPFLPPEKFSAWQVVNVNFRPPTYY